MMKILFILNFMFVSICSLADDGLRLPEAGRLTFTKVVHLEMLKRNEVVYTFNDQGRARLAELRDQEFICEYKGRETHLCSKFLSVDGKIDENVLADATNRFAEEEIEFFPRSGEPELTAKGESYREYFVPQKVRVGGRNYESYRYGIIQDQLHKLTFGEPATDGLIAMEGGLFQKILLMNHRVSDRVFENYMFSGDFRAK